MILSSYLLLSDLFSMGVLLRMRSLRKMWMRWRWKSGNRYLSARLYSLLALVFFCNLVSVCCYLPEPKPKHWYIPVEQLLAFVHSHPGYTQVIFARCCTCDMKILLVLFMHRVLPKPPGIGALVRVWFAMSHCSL